MTGKKRGRPGKEKKEKDPNAPKRPPSAYIEYQNSVREDFRKQYSDLPYSEVLKKIGLVWQGMTDAEKKVCSFGRAPPGEPELTRFRLQTWHDITEEKKTKYMADKTAYEGENGVATPAAPVAPKEPKKRGRKSNAEKAALAAAAAAAADIPVEDSKKKKVSVSPRFPSRGRAADTSAWMTRRKSPLLYAKRPMTRSLCRPTLTTTLAFFPTARERVGGGLG